MAQRRRRRQTDPEVLAEIERLAARGLSGAVIHRHLEERDDLRDRMVSLRTVQSILAELDVRDSSGDWSLADDEDGGVGARFVLSVLRTVMEATEGRRRHLTMAEARWLKRIHRVAPDLDTWRSYLVARAYMRASQEGTSAADIDAFLAFAPWRTVRDEDGDDAYSNAAAFREAVERGWTTNTERALVLEAMGVEDPNRALRTGGQGAISQQRRKRG